MNLSEMLEYTRSYIDDTSGTLIEGDNDQLWSDLLLVNFMNQAEKLLCRRAWVLVDTGVAPAGRIVLATGVALYPLHASVLHVFDAQPSTQDYPLGRGTDTQLKSVSDTSGFDAFEIGEAAALAGDTLTGVTLSIATDAGTRMMRVYPTPTATENGVVVALKVARMPVTPLTLDDVEAEPESDAQWHTEICHFAAGRALTLPNVDSEFRTVGRTLLTEFAETVRQARQERVRAEMGGGRWAFNSTTATLGR